MYKELIHTPEGVRDIYGSEYKAKLKVCSDIRETIAAYHYEPIQIPTFEYFDVFSREVGTTQSSDLYKFFDRNGDTLVLRPDFTPGVARCVAKYYDVTDKPVKLTYEGNVFVNNSSLQGKLKESTQIGVELMNDDSVEADAEVIELAIETLKASGLSDFQVSVGHMEYFKGLCEVSGISEADELKLREYISEKNNVPATELLDSLHCDKETADLLIQAGESIGDASKLAALKEKVKNQRSLNAINRLLEIHKIIKERGNERFISFDLGLLSKYNYYTGTIFKAYVFGAGDAIVKGGRYDNLVSYFGNPKAAIGFVILIDDLMMALKRRNQDGKVHRPYTEEGKYLTFALTKGRLADKTLALMEKIGITCQEMKDKDSRKLIFVNEELKLKFFLAKGPDVPTYVEYGAADIGVTGKDTLLEEKRRAYEVLDLGFGKCRMCVCGYPSAKELLERRDMIRVATKYPVIAKDYFYNRRHQTVDIIKLNGSVELGPIVELSDVIVDIVETGSTLKENGLTVLEEVCPLSARMIVNQVSMQMESKRINDIISRLKDELNENN